MNRIILIILLATFPLLSYSQSTILNNDNIQEKIEACLYATYGFNFNSALRYHHEIAKQIPSHPATSFLEAIIIYWENFPLLPHQKELETFEQAMQKTISLSQRILEKSPNDIEGIFFDMHARAFLAMFWADNGRPSKVIKDLNNLYQYTIEGIDRKNEFNEFYFSSGLYKYYIESYAENRPVYKPVLSLFRKGNKKEGLEDLQYAAINTTFLKNEAIFFISLLELNYENNLDRAGKYAGILYSYFPKNIYYLNHYLIILSYQKNFEILEILSNKIKNKKDRYTEIVYHTCYGILLENKYKNFNAAKNEYLNVIQMAEHFGMRADIQAAIAYAGLSRIAYISDHNHEGHKYAKKSKQRSSYSFILDF